MSKLPDRVLPGMPMMPMGVWGRWGSTYSPCSRSIAGKAMLHTQWHQDGRKCAFIDPRWTIYAKRGLFGFAIGLPGHRQLRIILPDFPVRRRRRAADRAGGYDRKAIQAFRCFFAETGFDAGFLPVQEPAPALELRLVRPVDDRARRRSRLASRPGRKGPAPRHPETSYRHRSRRRNPSRGIFRAGRGGRPSPCTIPARVPSRFSYGQSGVTSVTSRSSSQARCSGSSPRSRTPKSLVLSAPVPFQDSQRSFSQPKYGASAPETIIEGFRVNRGACCRVS